ACGKAVALRAQGIDCHMWVPMGDGEQQKGQVGEARRFAMKFGLGNVTAIIDYNQLQISGNIHTVMPQNICDDWRADGWRVVEVDGHDLDALYAALRESRYQGGKVTPTMILAHTTMGKGYPAIENDHNYHGVALSVGQAAEAFAALGFDDPKYNDIAALSERRASGVSVTLESAPVLRPQVATGEPRTYRPDQQTDNRSAWGAALVDIAEANASSGTPTLVFDCDLASSVKTAGFEKKFPERFFQCGISEHSTATAAGGASSEGALTFWSDFGVFGVCETYNQNRLNDINHTNLKVVCTHCGLDVGEDGKTHQCIDYFGLSRSVFGWRMYTPADPNQTDRIVRYVAAEPGNFLVVMGRSKMNPLASPDGSALFGGDYEFVPGRVDLLREGADVVIVCAGNVAGQGLAAWEALANEGAAPRLVSSAHWADFSLDDLRMIAEFGRIVTVEDHNVNNGFGMSLSAELFAAGLSARIIKLGAREYGPSGKSADVYRAMGIDGPAIASAARALRKEPAPAGHEAVVKA
ncbi:MAG TPA: transketolase, partial [candidate division Zixibacteria bacterium]|nr:transketolase [candidate division Zixibacteria bacterium]